MRRVLLVTETSDLAADLLVLAANDRGIPLERFNQDDFPRRISIRWPVAGAVEFQYDGRAFTDADIAGSWFRRARNLTFHHEHSAAFAARESGDFLSAVWETVPWFWINQPTAAARAEYKLAQLREAQRLGFAVPTTLVTNCAEAARRFAEGREIVAKTLAGGRFTVGSKDYAVFTTLVSADDVTAAGDTIQACPVIFQDRIKTRFDLRVTVVGEQAFAARIFINDRTAGDLDWRQADPNRLFYERQDLDAGLAARCTKLVAAMGLVYGALDFVVTSDDNFIFLELNPAGQWGWIEQALGLQITDAILDRLWEG